MIRSRLILYLTLGCILALGLILQAGCGDDDPVGPEPVDGVIMPLAVGNIWRYDVYHYPSGADPYVTYDSIVVVNDSVIGQELRFKVNENEWFVNRVDGLWYKPPRTSTMYLLFKYPAKLWDTWIAGISNELGMELFARDEQVTTDAGTFSCYRYLQDRLDTDTVGVRFYWVAPDIGIVQYIQWNKEGTEMEEVGVLADFHLEE